MRKRVEVLKLGEGPSRSGLRSDLAEQIETADKGIARMIRSAATELELLDTPFLKKGRVCQFTYSTSQGPMSFFIGSSDTGWAGLLSGQPKNFFRLAKVGQLEFDRHEDHLNYLFTYLKSTRAIASEFRVLRSAQELKLSPAARASSALAKEKESQLKEIRSAYQSLIEPPSISSRIPLRAVIFAVKKRDLVRYDLELNRDGIVEEIETPLEFNLPLS